MRRLRRCLRRDLKEEPAWAGQNGQQAGRNDRGRVSTLGTGNKWNVRKGLKAGQAAGGQSGGTCGVRLVSGSRWGTQNVGPGAFPEGTALGRWIMHRHPSSSSSSGAKRSFSVTTVKCSPSAVLRGLAYVTPSSEVLGRGYSRHPGRDRENNNPIPACLQLSGLGRAPDLSQEVLPWPALMSPKEGIFPSLGCFALELGEPSAILFRSLYCKVYSLVWG